MREFLYYGGQFLGEHILLQVFFMYVMPFMVLGAACMSPFKTRLGEFFATTILVSYVAFLLFTGAHELFVGDDYLPPVRSVFVTTSHPTSTPRPTSTPLRTSTPTPMSTSASSTPLVFYYQMNYPMTWGYISKYSSAPESYLQTYDRIWGDLQRYHGDGIPFDTLSRYEQSLVNYPGIGSYIYFANASSREYHSTVYCYTLLRSNPVQRSSRYASQYNPCSKCVGD